VNPSTLALFCVAALALAVVPGPAVLYIVAQSVDQGRLAGFVSALGIGVGGLVHVLAATIGLSSLLASSATAFTIVKYAGAAYLVFLGIRRLLTRETAENDIVRAPRSRRRLFVDGVVVNVLNPKTALFFIAFLPQFVDPDAGAATLQIFALGLTFVVIALGSDSLWALTAGTLGGWLKQSPAYFAVRRWVTGTVFVALGVSTARTT
jgi:threonine/homoserine/homoserine lactone efflux protein